MSTSFRPRQLSGLGPEAVLSPSAFRIGSTAVVLVALSVVLWSCTDLGARDTLGDAATNVALISLDEIQPPLPPLNTSELFTLENHNLHPDRLFQPYFGGSNPSVFDTPHVRSMLHPLHDLMEMYVVRQGHDDNFTIRMLDNRTNELLELFVLQAERANYMATGKVVWDDIDRKRSMATRELLDKYEDQGIPREALTVRWGRANQMVESRERKEPIMAYELRLAQYLGLSLLVTELGTVETFNNDRLVSPVGARGRYQMMPFQLRAHGIHQYALRAANGGTVDVREEWHPLLTLEPAFLMVRSHVNAFGNEIAGISAYHTGPGNIYRLLRIFLSENPDALTYPHTVLDAYMWGLTNGFETVSSKTTFRNYSRGYIPSAYGALRATQHIPVDTTRTLRAERVQVAAGKSVYLSELLRTLEEMGDLDWGLPVDQDTLTPYERFQELNPHFDLPQTEHGTLSARGDVRIVSAVDGHAVRFFLPLDATQLLAQYGLPVLDEAKTFRFDETTYTIPEAPAYTFWDEQYDQLVERIERFGFTPENKKRLNALAQQFEMLAELNPSHFRKTRLHIIQAHQRLWQFSDWDRLADVTEVAMGNRRLPPRPPVPLDLDKPLPSTVFSGSR